MPAYESEALLGMLSAGTLRLVIGDLESFMARAAARLTTDRRPGARESAIADRDDAAALLDAAKNALEAAK